MRTEFLVAEIPWEELCDYILTGDMVKSIVWSEEIPIDEDVQYIRSQSDQDTELNSSNPWVRRNKNR